MSELGVGAYRFSVSWPRIIPEGHGRVNSLGLDFYDRLIDYLLEAQIEPWVCLYHWDHPQVLEEQGGWANRKMAGWFSDFVVAVALRFADRLKHICVFNEPNLFTHLAYCSGRYPPNLTDRRQVLSVTHNFNLAAGLGIQAIREINPKIEIGTLLSIPYSVRLADTEEEHSMIEEGLNISQWSFIDPIQRGSYSKLVTEMLGDLIQENDLKQINQGLDFLGINYYTRIYLKACRDHYVEQVMPRAEDPKTSLGWDIFPEGLRMVLEEVRQRYGDLPVYVTENGAVFDDVPSPSGFVDDKARINFLQSHLEQLCLAIEDGIDVRGYFIWTLTDCYEWCEGFDARFGLVRVDYDADLKRTPKASYYWFQKVCKDYSIAELPNES